MDLKKYIGIPFRDHGCGYDGCDCYGLVRLVYARELGIELPHLGDQYSNAFARGEIGPLPAATVAEGWAVDVTDLEPEQFDVLVFSRGGLDYHVGLFMYGETMLHCVDGTDSCLEKWCGIRWHRQLSRRLRHVSRMKVNA